MAKKESNVFDTKYVVSKYIAPSFERVNTNLVSSIDGVFKESMEKDTQYGKILKEAYFKEGNDGINTTTASGSYVTLLQNIIHNAMLDDTNLKKAESLVFINDDMVRAAGYGAYQIPRMDPTIAVEVAEGAVVSYFDEGVEPIVVVPRKYIASTKITWEIRKRGMSSLMNYVLGLAKDSLVRKRISNIVNGIAAGAGTTITGGVSYANFVAARKAVVNATASNGEKYNFLPTHFVVSAENYSEILLDESFQKAMFPANANNNIRATEIGIQNPLKAIDCEIWETPLLTAAQAFVIDSKKFGMLCKEAEYEMFEGRLPGSPDTEILALMSEVLGVIFPKAAAKITA